MTAAADAVPRYGDLFRLDGSTVAVLGGGDGIGRQTAHALCQQGARVAVIDRDADRARQVAEEVGGVPFAIDVTRRAELTETLSEIARAMPPLWGLVDVVGAATLRPLAEFDDQAWDAQFDIVLRHAFVAVQVAAESMAAAGGGAIVLVGSTSGVAFTPGQTVYGTAKAALHHFVECAGRELAARGVRVNAVAPGYTRTPRLNAVLGDEQWSRIEQAIPQGQAGLPSEIAAPIAFLLSSAASYITGQVLTADGGLTGTVPSVF